MLSRLRDRIAKLEEHLMPPEPSFVFVSFGESDEEFDTRLREFRLKHGLMPNSALHTVRVRFNEGPGKQPLSPPYRKTPHMADN